MVRAGGANSVEADRRGHRRSQKHCPLPRGALSLPLPQCAVVRGPGLLLALMGAMGAAGAHRGTWGVGRRRGQRGVCGRGSGQPSGFEGMRQGGPQHVHSREVGVAWVSRRGTQREEGEGCRRDGGPERPGGKCGALVRQQWGHTWEVREGRQRSHRACAEEEEGVWRGPAAQDADTGSCECVWGRWGNRGGALIKKTLLELSRLPKEGCAYGWHVAWTTPLRPCHCFRCHWSTLHSLPDKGQVLALRAYCARRGWDTHPRIPVTCLGGGDSLKTLEPQDTRQMHKCNEGMWVVSYPRVPYLVGEG